MTKGQGQRQNDTRTLNEKYKIIFNIYSFRTNPGFREEIELHQILIFQLLSTCLCCKLYQNQARKPEDKRSQTIFFMIKGIYSQHYQMKDMFKYQNYLLIQLNL